MMRNAHNAFDIAAGEKNSQCTLLKLPVSITVLLLYHQQHTHPAFIGCSSHLPHELVSTCFLPFSYDSSLVQTHLCQRQIKWQHGS